MALFSTFACCCTAVLTALHLCDAPFTHALGSKPVDNKRSGVRRAAGECLLGNVEPLAEARNVEAARGNEGR